MSDRLLALDFGSKTVGVAVCDELRLTAAGVEIIRRERENKLRRTLARIEELVAEYEPSGIVRGLPLMPGGEEGERCEKTREFAKMLSDRVSIPIFFQDERLTTVEAEEIMDGLGIARRDYKEYVDMIAAKVILEDYLNASS